MTTQTDDAAKLAAKEFIDAMKASDPWTDACWLCDEEYGEWGAIDQGLCYKCAWTHYYAEVEEKKDVTKATKVGDDDDSSAE